MTPSGQSRGETLLAKEALLSKQEAATFLEISIRSIERYTRQGRSKPTPMYRQDDLETFKAQIKEKQRSVAVQTSHPAPVVAFRLPQHYFNLLREEGERHALSAGEYARTLLIDALEGGERLGLQEDIALLRCAVEILGADLATGVLALLLHAGRVENEVEARAWITANLKGVRPSEGRR